MVEYIGLAVSTVAGLFAVHGNTWKPRKDGEMGRPTVVGWITLFLVLAGTTTTVIAKKQEEAQKRIAVSPIISDFYALANHFDEMRYFLDIASSQDDPRSAMAREHLEISIRQNRAGLYCGNFVDSWEDWKHETKPASRSTLSTMALLCKSARNMVNYGFVEAVSDARKLVCIGYPRERHCDKKAIKELETRYGHWFRGIEAHNRVRRSV